MSSVEIFRRPQFREGLWRNGLGVSWDIASHGAGNAFDWRLAIARIDSDAPFSAYPGIDRVFTLIEGAGLELDVADAGTLPVLAPFVPTHFSGDAACACRLVDGPCRALNLFLRRDAVQAQVIIHEGGGPIDVGHSGHALLFVLHGTAQLGEASLELNDAARISGAAQVTLPPQTVLYEARLLARPT